MKRIFMTLLMTSLLISCGSRSDDPFSNTYLLEVYGSIRIPMYQNISEPALDSEDSFWYAADEDKRVLTRSDISGNILDRITLYVFPAVDNIANLHMGPDMNTALFTVSSGEYNIRDICRLTFDSSDHNAFQLDGSLSFMIPNPLSLSITDLSEPWGNQVAYLGTYFDSGTWTATQNVSIYDYDTGTTQVVDLDPGVYPLSSDGRLTGNYYDRIDAFPNSELPDVVSSFIICQRLEGADSVSHTIKIIRSDGSVDFDATGIYEYQEIGGVRWLSQEEVLMTVKRDDTWQILSINSEGTEKIFYKGDSDIYAMPRC